MILIGAKAVLLDSYGFVPFIFTQVEKTPEEEAEPEKEDPKTE